ncbi:hypothetical protein EJ08DRAFT_158710 [Tothia fuscella]|uniref:Zn(2)-C6 fungal-type domain-containing protein n=1 Tax=Tothia fuscella TaxID=1048955 RepID=A0A9P4TZT9_9PEZI|nr:hypothetical protein EJ08DRAFT_158710 [Tothia fuscella]
MRTSSSNANGARACCRCREKKIHCGREKPSCKACDSFGVNCAYPSTNDRYAVSRVRSCIECRRQRAKCDRKRPCSSCVTSKVKCIYTAASVGGGESTAESDSGAVGTNAFQNLITTTTNRTYSPDNLNPAILLGSDAHPAIVTPLHPSNPAQIWMLWHIYMKNVDSLYKIFHAPSFEKQLFRGVQNLQTIDADVETLLFAVYFAAITSVTNEDCQDRFSESKIVLLKRYRYALEKCLTRAMFLEIPQLVSLRAFVLYITACRDAPVTAPIDTLLALAIRLAIKLEVHKEHSRGQQQSSRFITLGERTNTELRRRLWWHLISLDVQIAESSGTDPTIIEGTFNASFPSSMDDGELDDNSDLPLPPLPGESFNPETYAINQALDGFADTYDQEHKIDMSYALVRMEIASGLRRYAFSEQFCQINGYEVVSTSAARLQHVNELVGKVNMKYLQYCQRNDFFSSFARNAAKLMLSKHLMLVKRADSAQQTLHNCTQVLEAAVGLRRTHPSWAWTLRSYVELDVLEVYLHSLVDIQNQPAIWDAEYEGQLKHGRALSLAAVERGREHDLKLCYPKQWKRIESLHQRLNDAIS